MPPDDVWASLDATNSPTSDISHTGARAISPLSHAALLLTPALHLLTAAHGTADLTVAKSQSEAFWNSVKEKTKADYSRKIIAYLAWCDDLGIPEHFRFPIAANILVLYLQKDITTLRPGSVDKRSHALLYWHRVQRLPWALHKADSRALTKAAKIQGLPALEKRRPPSHAVGGPASVILRLPTEKVHGNDGLDRIAAEQRQMPELCPVAAMRRHLLINALRPGEEGLAHGAFSYVSRSGSRNELTDGLFGRSINAWLAKGERERVTGHCFRIGGATLLFAAGKPLEDIKLRGGWGSDAYLLYLRDLYVRQATMFSDLDLQTLCYG
ncbi:unnamed protein product [Tilletia laevis]|nr:unnamed protein product [Tilletia laevis]